MFIYKRIYRGRLLAVLLDWAGTTVDYGCMAPVAVFQDVFAARRVPITLTEARAPMGMYKRDHIQAIARMPAVAARWQEQHGDLPSETDIDSMFADATPMQVEAIKRHANVIPGVVETIATYRAQGLKIASCTGYTRPMMATLLPLAEAQGYAPDIVVCPDEVPAGRPAPWMAFSSAMRLGVYPMEAWVKIGDTVMDIEEGLNAGMWTIGLARTGNELGLSETEAAALSPEELEAHLNPIRRKLYAAGAHYVADSLADTLPVLEAINVHMANGEKP